MKPEFYQVHPTLRDFVNYIKIVDFRLDGKTQNNIAPYPPLPQNCINFYTQDVIKSRKLSGIFTELPDCAIIGPQTSRSDILLGAHHQCISVAFHPGGMLRLLRIPLYEMLDQHFDATDVLGSKINEVNEKLKQAKHHLEMKNIVEAYLLNKINQEACSPFERALRLMLEGDRRYTIDQAAALSCLSVRQFERRSKEATGYSPSFFLRLIRFSKAYRMRVNHPGSRWTTIGQHCGYYDQMHLIRDFKEFADGSPKILANEILRSPYRIQGDQRI